MIHANIFFISLEEYVRFSSIQYVFVEEQQTGSVVVQGPTYPATVRVTGGQYT